MAPNATKTGELAELEPAYTAMLPALLKPDPATKRDRAEELARTCLAALVPFGASTTVSVTWDTAPWFMLPMARLENAIRRAAAAAFASYPLAPPSKKQLIFVPTGAHMSAHWLASASACWDRAARSGTVVDAVPDAEMVSTDRGPFPRGRRFDELQNPFTPLLDVHALGLMPYAVSDSEAKLLAPQSVRGPDWLVKLDRGLGVAVQPFSHRALSDKALRATRDALARAVTESVPADLLADLEAVDLVEIGSDGRFASFDLTPALAARIRTAIVA
jgi:hypothetical protein